jgi:hypothetical protein
MRTTNLSNNNALLNILLTGLALSVMFFVTVIAFMFGTQWTNFRRQILSPAINPVLQTALPVMESPGFNLTETPILVETPSPTPTSSATSTTILTASPTATATPSSTVISPTPNNGGASTIPADRAKIIETTPEDGIYSAPKYQFKKVWTIKNIGTTTWNTDYDLVFISGTAMNEKMVFALKEKVKPGGTISISLNQTAPKKPGIYQGSWMLRNSKGYKFGSGTEADQPLIVKIHVLNIDPGNAYDFLLNYCNAEWWNSKGQSIRCDGAPNQTNGFVLLDTHSVLENGKSDLPILWVHPYYKSEGVISGKYPAYTVKNGDHFKARIGCIGNYPKCNITFKLLYRIGNSSNQELGSWQELYGGGTTAIDVDLSHLAGQKVQFILRTVCTNNNPDHAQGFWKTPRITYIQPLPTHTPTMTASPSPTPTETSTPVEEIPTDIPLQ